MMRKRLFLCLAVLTAFCLANTCEKGTEKIKELSDKSIKDTVVGEKAKRTELVKPTMIIDSEKPVLSDQKNDYQDYLLERKILLVCDEPRIGLEEKKDDPDLRIYHLSVKITGEKFISGKFKERLSDIAGVSDVFSFPYKVEIRKAPLFTWEEVQPQIIEVLKKSL